MPRCKSEYTNRNAEGKQLSPTRRCTREDGHKVDPRGKLSRVQGEMHQWMRNGHAVRWSDEAADA